MEGPGRVPAIPTRVSLELLRGVDEMRFWGEHFLWRVVVGVGSVSVQEAGEGGRRVVVDVRVLIEGEVVGGEDAVWVCVTVFAAQVVVETR